MRKVLVIIVLVSLCSLIFAQERKTNIQKGPEKSVKGKSPQELVIDSLKVALMISKEDTNKVDIYISLSDIYRNFNPDEGVKFGEKGLELAQKIQWNLGTAKCHNAIGLNFWYKSNFTRALEYFQNALRIYEELDNKNGIVLNHINIGQIFEKQSNYSVALDYFNKALKISEEIGYKKGIARSLENISYVLQMQKNYTQALESHLKVIKINEELGNKSAVSRSLVNIANIYQMQNNYTQAIEYNLKVLKINEEIGNKSYVASSFGNIGSIYYAQSNFHKALEYLNNALLINEELGNKKGVAFNLGIIALINTHQSDYTRALENYHDALKIYAESGDKKNIAINLGNMATVYNANSKYSLATEYLMKALKINEELGDKKGVAVNLINISNIYLSQSNYSKALENSLKSLKLNEELGDNEGVATSLAHIGSIYSRLSNFDKALEYFHKSLSLNQDTGNNLILAQTLAYIGNIYTDKLNYDKALEYLTRSLKIHDDLGDKKGRATSYNNIGIILKKQLNLEDALEYFNKSKNINIEIGDSLGIAISIANIGELYLIQTRDSIINKSPNSNQLIENKEANIIKAIEHLIQAFEISKSINSIDKQADYLELLSVAYSQKGDFKNAYQSFKEFEALKDSIFSMDKEMEFANLEAKRENELKDKEIEIKAKENEILKQQSYNQSLELDKRNSEVSLLTANQQLQKLELSKRNSELSILQKDKELAELSILAKESEAQNKGKEIELLQANEQKQKIEIKQAAYQRYALIAGLMLFSLFIIIIFVRFREKKKLSDKLAIQNFEIENQKSQLEEKSTEILDSINYAATIQNALLPWSSVLSSNFKEHFIIYKPKDIVSGDFYWFQEVDGVKYIAVIDCTGHGIPGAMLTVIASSVLDDAVLGKRLNGTAQILTYMNEKVTEVLNQRLAENSIRDGMEVALIAIYQDKIQFSGAGRPLYMNNVTMGIIKTDKRGIAGQTDNDDYQFSSIEIEKSENLMLYLSSDGFADQMNESSKKYSTKRLVSLLDTISDKPISEQKEILENEFNSHKGERSQIDDITILGVRV